MAKKIPVPKVKTKKSGSSFPLSSTLIGIASLFNRRPLMLTKLQGTNPASWGTKAWRANKLANLSKMGKWATRGRLLAPALMNPWLMAPAALLGGAKYAVSKSFAPYKDAEGNWTKEGLEQMSQARMEREERTRANAAKRGELAWMDDPNFDFWGGGLKASKLADYPELAEKYKYNMNEGGIARLL